jgi:demethylmenaquinone methyltransferase/2-methoxy-6-polyprenyl-1,4-benzoquinol methylase
MGEIEVKEANIEHFKLEARFYDQVHFEIFNEAEQKYIDETLSRLWKELKSKKSCLDMGCGTGNITKKELGFFAQVIGLDLSRRMLLPLKERAESRNLSLTCGDCENLPFEDNRFDFISMYSTLHHLPHPFLAFKEMFRTLKIGGMIYVAHEPNALKYRVFLGPIRNMASLLGYFVTKKSSKYPRLVLSQKKLGPLTDIHVQYGFSSNQIRSRLESLGFSNVYVAFHDLLQFIFAALPTPLNQLVKLDHFLEKNKIIAPLCYTIIITAKKE